jgi:hypothetical protein
MSTPEPDGHRLDAVWRIRVVIDSLHRLSTSRNRYLEKDLEVIFSDRFLHAMARDPHAARQIHEATGEPLPTLYKWRDHLEVGATWRPWNHKVNHGSHKRKLKVIEVKLIEEALNERSARGGKTDRKPGRTVVRQITLETRGVWIDMCLSSMGYLMHRLGFTTRAAHVRRSHEADPHAKAAFQAAVDGVLADPGFPPAI